MAQTYEEMVEATRNVLDEITKIKSAEYQQAAAMAAQAFATLAQAAATKEMADTLAQVHEQLYPVAMHLESISSNLLQMRTDK